MRRGMFLRAPALRNLDATEVATLAALQLGLIVDFRQPIEVADWPVTVPASDTARRLSLAVRTGASARLLMAEASAPVDHAAATAAMTEAYRDFVRLNADTFAAFLRAVVSAPGPVLFHCTAGKDRTGFAAALLLAALGVGRVEIMADFMATADLWTPDADLVGQILPAARPAVLGVQTAYLDAAFEELDRMHGGAAAFATAVLGSPAHAEWTQRSLI